MSVRRSPSKNDSPLPAGFRRPERINVALKIAAEFQNLDPGCSVEQAREQFQTKLSEAVQQALEQMRSETRQVAAGNSRMGGPSMISYEVQAAS
jgi:hypothetical protein